MADKLVFMITHGTDDPEHVTIPFVMAAAALASDVQVVIGLQADAVWLGTKGGGDAVAADGFPPLAKLMNDYREMGGKLLVCNPCMKSRGIDPATQLGQELGGAEDGPGQEGGEERDIRGELEEVLLGGLLAAEDVDGVAGGLEGEEGDAHGQGQADQRHGRGGPYPTGDLVDGRDEEVHVLIDRQDAQVDRAGAGEPGGP